MKANVGNILHKKTFYSYIMEFSIEARFFVCLNKIHSSKSESKVSLCFVCIDEN